MDSCSSLILLFLNLYSNNSLIFSYSQQHSWKMLPVCQNLRYYCCPLQGHSQQALSRVCIEATCPDKTLLCHSCISALHQNHETLPLKDFIDQVENIVYCPVSEQITKNTAQRLKSQKVDCLQVAKISRNWILSLYRNLETSIINYFDGREIAFEEEFKSFTKMRPAPIKFHDGYSVDQAKDIFRQSTTSFNIYRSNSQQLKFKCQIALDIISETSSKMLTLLQEFQRKTDDLITRMNNILCWDHSNYQEKLNLLKSVNTSIPIDTKQAKQIYFAQQLKQKLTYNGFFQFNDKLKHSDLQITNKIVKRYQNNTHSWPVCILMDPIIRPECRYQWSISVDKIETLLVGICIEDRIKELGFVCKRELNQPGHGNYIISNGGKVFSHTEGKSQQSKLNFRTGDTIKCIFENESLLITNSKGQTQKIRISTSQGKLRACIYLQYPDEFVEVD